MFETSNTPNAPALGSIPLEQQTVWTIGDGAVRLLVIDNYDSFTYNLVQTLVRFDTTLEVVRNDLWSVDQVLARGADGLVLSPGPGRPEDAGICVELLRRGVDVPILGVCLGHQALGLAFGARIDAAPILMHGKTSLVDHQDHAMFAGVAQSFVATRYHSLCVGPDSLGDELRPLASSDDGVVMAMEHRTRPYWGMQFHPESILTEAGPRLLENFVVATRAHRRDGGADSP